MIKEVQKNYSNFLKLQVDEIKQKFEKKQMNDQELLQNKLILKRLTQNEKDFKIERRILSEEKHDNIKKFSLNY